MTDTTKRLMAAARSLNRAIDDLNTDRWLADLAHGETPDDDQRLVALLTKAASAAENAADARTLERNAW